MVSANNEAPDDAGASAETLGGDADSERMCDGPLASGPAPNQFSSEDSALRPVDVTTLTDRPVRPYIVKDLWPVKSILGIAAEEGDGKTLMAEQLLRQILRRQPVMDFFEVGGARPTRILFIDTEMEEEDAAERNADMMARGLAIGPGQLYWHSTGGLTLDDDLDFRAIQEAVSQLRIDLVWIDSATNAVSEPEEGVPVKRLFNNLSKLMREQNLLGLALSLHTRKRAQGSNERRFDDLFGSREWKGRLGTTVYMEGNRIVSWKNRGGRLTQAWPTKIGGRPAAVLNRPGLNDATVVPFTISLPEDGKGVDEAEIEAKVRETLAREPDMWTKSRLAEKVGCRKEDALQVIQRLQDDAVIIPNIKRAKLRLAVIVSQDDNLATDS